MKKAFIVGNGTSRIPIPLPELVGKGVIFGCNALYRDFTDYDYLVSIDNEIIEEVQDKANDDRLIIPDEEDRWEHSDYSKNRRRSNAGMNAMIEAVNKDCTKIYCLGFDFILKDKISTSNVYEDTECYGSETHANESDNPFRVKYLSWYMKQNKDTNFTFVLPRNFKYESLSGPNVTGIYIDKFMAKYCG
jgi:hypothetical protein|tara:strand:+ start:233 stop:802 length:570 start_codon:yes stop_codon:yes gene_type:complete